MKIILATTSINRHQLFDRLGIKYQVIPSLYEENITDQVRCIDQVKEFALGKSQDVYDQIHKKYSEILSEDFCIIGFDSMVDIEGKSIGKPMDRLDSASQIKSFRGKIQHIRSGISMMGKFSGKNFKIVECESTEILFRNDYSSSDIETYLTYNDWQGKCGSYSILGTGIFFLEKISGDFQNIIGVPVLRMQKMLEKITKKSAWDIFDKK